MSVQMLPSNSAIARKTIWTLLAALSPDPQYFIVLDGLDDCDNSEAADVVIEETSMTLMSE